MTEIGVITAMQGYIFCKRNYDREVSSKLLNFFDFRPRNAMDAVEIKAAISDVVGHSFGKFDRLPNTGHLQIWFQRISQPIATDIHYSEPFCRLISGEPLDLWNNHWITNKELVQACNPQNILDRESMKTLSMVIEAGEFQVFEY